MYPWGDGCTLGARRSRVQCWGVLCRPRGLGRAMARQRGAGKAIAAGPGSDCRRICKGRNRDAPRRSQNCWAAGSSGSGRFSRQPQDCAWPRSSLGSTQMCSVSARQMTPLSASIWYRFRIWVWMDRRAQAAGSKHRDCAAAGASLAAVFSLIGRRRRNLDPWCGWLSASIRPQSVIAISRANASPKPRPP